MNRSAPRAHGGERERILRGAWLSAAASWSAVMERSEITAFLWVRTDQLCSLSHEPRESGDSASLRRRSPKPAALPHQRTDEKTRENISLDCAWICRDYD